MHRLAPRGLAAGLVAVVAATLAAGCAIERPEPTRTPPPRDAALAAQGWRIAWWDEFDGAEVEKDRWDVLDDSTFGEGNLEEACLMDDNVEVRGGRLVITARREAEPVLCGDDDPRFPEGRQYTSGFVQMRDAEGLTHGRFEIRARTPTWPGRSQGLWPAFWLRPVDRERGELDVMEMIGTGPETPDGDRAVTQTIHDDYSGTHPKEASTYLLPSGGFSSEFHEFAVEWEPGTIRWYVDDVLTNERSEATTPWLSDAFDRGEPFIVRLNLAVGGRWPGSPTTETTFPASYEIDYVRVYQR